MTSLKSVKEEANKYCFPAVISALCNITTDEAEKEIQRLRGNIKPVTTVYANEGMEVLRKYKWRTVQTLVPKQTLFYTLSILHPADGIWVTIVAHHVVLIEIEKGNTYFLDNHTRQPINAGSAARLGQTVKLMHRVERI